MGTKASRLSDFAIFCGLVALIIFGHLAATENPARGALLDPLLLQGAGIAYELEVNQQATELEHNARYALYQLGASQISYAGSASSGRYAEFDQLIKAGYLQPNQTGRSLASGYSISFYLPGTRRGFTISAEAQDLSLRSFMISENQQVVLLTPSVFSDPNESWATVRAMESELGYSQGYYDYLNGLQLLSYNPPLQVRINVEQTNYVLCSYIQTDEDTLELDDSIIYSSTFGSYMLGDDRGY